jgi:protein subunit release factor B
VEICEDRLEINFVRASGAGGQNVNKVSTKVELRMNVMDASWIPLEVRERLQQQQANRINKDGWLALTAQEHRTQGQNRKTALAKLEKMLLDAWPRPIIRKERKGVSKAAKARNKEFKRKRSDTKANRKSVDW